MLPPPLDHTLGLMENVITRVGIVATTHLLRENGNPFESWSLVVVVVVLFVINLSYKESLWLPLGKTYVTNEITLILVYLLFANKSKTYFSYHLFNDLLDQQQ